MHDWMQAVGSGEELELNPLPAELAAGEFRLEAMENRPRGTSGVKLLENGGVSYASRYVLFFKYHLGGRERPARSNQFWWGSPLPKARPD